MSKPVHRRVIVKLSGEALAGSQGSGIDQATIDRVAADLVGGASTRCRDRRRGRRRQHFSRRGSLRARRVAPDRRHDGHARDGDERPCAGSRDRAQRRAGAHACRRSPFRKSANPIRASARASISPRAGSWCCPAGTGNPHFTTDTTAVLRACELECDAVLKATNVDGVYSADPKRDPAAKRYERLSHQEAIEKNLKVMDATAFALARENAYAYHCVFDRRAGSDRNGIERKGSFHGCRRIDAGSRSVRA